MKKLGLFLLLLFMPVMVNATNHIYKIDMNIYLNEDGSASVTEVWDVDGDDGTEWYKAMYNLGNSQLTNFKVVMDSKELKEKPWNIDESLQQKSGYYGINYASDGIELCWGKTDYNRHQFVISYNLSNYVFNTSDSQVLYWKLVDTLSNVQFDHFSAKLSSYYAFPNTLDVWGYGYKGYAYVKDGVIEMSDESGMGNNYAVLLVKFPLDTFKTTNTDNRFNSFQDVYDLANKGSYNYDDNKKKSNKEVILVTVITISLFWVFYFISIKACKPKIKKLAGFKYNKRLNIKDIPMFRDIPCNKDIYYANALAKLNDFTGYKETNILGAIILKWVKEEKIIFRKQTSSSYGVESTVIDLSSQQSFDNELESTLFNMMLEASNDGVLETREFERWCKLNSIRFLCLFSQISTSNIKKMYDSGNIYKRASRKECKYQFVMSDILYEESKNLLGLKKFLLEFSRIGTREVIEVHIWGEYLMYAYIFGIADTVAYQLKNLYPEVLEQINYDYDTLICVHNLSRTISSSISSTFSRSRTSSSDFTGSYSSGGGGHSSGGGGTGSFGGGGGGSR